MRARGGKRCLDLSDTRDVVPAWVNGDLSTTQVRTPDVRQYGNIVHFEITIEPAKDPLVHRNGLAGNVLSPPP